MPTLKTRDLKATKTIQKQSIHYSPAQAGLCKIFMDYGKFFLSINGKSIALRSVLTTESGSFRSESFRPFFVGGGVGGGGGRFGLDRRVVSACFWRWFVSALSRLVKSIGTS